MIYLASPYSHIDPAVREQRFQIASRVAADLFRRGHLVFSPVSHSHAIAIHGLPADWEFWRPFDILMLMACDELVVLMLDGWRESRGVWAEVNLAKKRGLPISYLKVEPDVVGPASPTAANVATEVRD